VPITHASIDFFKPMFCGDRIAITMTPELLNSTDFQINYQLFFVERDKAIGNLTIAKAITKHTCIDVATRKRCNLSPTLLEWLESCK
jgi:1,4-dihydroxy-2-naphthoyl-CoA hydrolase